MGLVDQQRHPRPIGLGQVDLALQLGVQHAQDEQQAGLAVLGADRAQVGVDDQDVARLDDLPQRNLGRVVKNRRSGGTPVRPEILLRGASRRSATRLVAMRRSSGSSERKNSAVWSRSGWSAQAAATAMRNSSFAGPQEGVDVLEPRAASLLGGERDRADHGVVEVAAGGLEDLVFVDVEQGGDDVVGDLGGLDRQRPVTDRPQRADPERGMPEVQVPHALAAVRRGIRRQMRELGLGVDDDRRRVLASMSLR